MGERTARGERILRRHAPIQTDIYLNKEKPNGIFPPAFTQVAACFGVWRDLAVFMVSKLSEIHLDRFFGEL